MIASSSGEVSDFRRSTTVDLTSLIGELGRAKSSAVVTGSTDSEEKEPGGRRFSESQGGLEWWREEGSGLDRRSELERLPEYLC